MNPTPYSTVGLQCRIGQRLARRARKRRARKRVAVRPALRGVQIDFGGNSAVVHRRQVGRIAHRDGKGRAARGPVAVGGGVGHRPRARRGRCTAESAQQLVKERTAKRLASPKNEPDPLFL